MSHLIKIGAGVGAVALAVVLGVALAPQLQESASVAKQAVAKPVFVPTPAGVAAPTAVATAPSEPAKDAALVKLAEALRVAPAANAPAAAPTRSLAYASTDSSKASPTVAAAAVATTSEKARQLCAQGLVALAAGDIAGARILLMRAADEGDTRALMALGETWEPATLAGLGALGVKGDPARARDYYNKALAAGVRAARDRLAALESN